MAAGCGGSKAPSVAGLPTTVSGSTGGGTHTTGGNASPPSPTQLQQDLLRYARCMRSGGVPDFPDPSPGGGLFFRAGSGVNPSSPEFRAAQAKCRKLLPGGGPPSPGSTTHPSPGALANMVEVARCMRRHGISGFPDPTTTVPSRPAGGGQVSIINGVVLVFPSTVDTQSPAFRRAATACGFPLADH